MEIVRYAQSTAPAARLKGMGTMKPSAANIMSTTNKIINISRIGAGLNAACACGNAPRANINGRLNAENGLPLSEGTGLQD